METSLAFKKYCKDIKKIYAFEPDQACYEACLVRKEEELVPEYKLYIRHYSNYQWETVLYAVMP